MIKKAFALEDELMRDKDAEQTEDSVVEYVVMI